MAGEMVMVIWDVEHGQCAMFTKRENGVDGQLAMIDSGCSPTWRPSDHISDVLKRNTLDYLFITNADQDHMSDLDGLWTKGISVRTIYKNRSYTGDQLRAIKLRSGAISKDAERYAKTCDAYTTSSPRIFKEEMGGISCQVFYNPYPLMEDTNNLSLAAFIKYEDVTVLFPGDLEKKGWLELLKNGSFCAALSDVDILVASHHGRESGFCQEVFEHCQPQVVIISDKSIVHATQNVDYRSVVAGGVYVATTGKTRRVLTTRRDGYIKIVVGGGEFRIETEKRG